MSTWMSMVIGIGVAALVVLAVSVALGHLAARIPEPDF